MLALPRTAATSIELVYHLALTIFGGIPALIFTQSPSFAKKHLFKCGRDLQEIVGHLLSLSIFKDELGLYLVQEAQFQKECYDKFVEKTPSRPINQDTTPSYLIGGQSRICNKLYNTLLDQAQQLRQQFIETKQPELAKTVYSERGLRNLIPQIKQEHPFYKVVHSSPLKNTALRLSEAIQTISDLGHTKPLVCR